MHFLEGMYSLFAGGFSRQTWISCETRGGITGTVFTASLAVLLARLAVVDDQIAPEELHLLRLVPGAWMRPGQHCAFEHLPTMYGPVTLRVTMAEDGELRITFQTAFRGHAPRSAHRRSPGL